MRGELRREIECELQDGSNSLVWHVYIKKCLSAYKCAAEKCSVNAHASHPDLFCNRSHIHVYEEHYDLALLDLRRSIRLAAIERGEQKREPKVPKGAKGESQAQQLHDELLNKLLKLTKLLAPAKAAGK